MGVCSSEPKSSITVPKPRNPKDREEIALSVALDKRINNEQVEASAQYKFIMLGSRGSGKSTFRRWAWALSGGDAGRAEQVIEGTKYDWSLYQRTSIANVRKYTIQVAKTICDTIRSHGLFVPTTTTAAASAGGVDVMTAIPQLKDNECVPTEIGAAIQAWWIGEEEKKPHDLKLSAHYFEEHYRENVFEPITPSPSGMRSVWLRHISRAGTNYPATDSTDHFMMRFATITSSEYKGDETDVVLCPLQLDDRPSQHILLTDLVRATVTTASSTLATVSAGDMNDIQQLPVPLLRVILGYANSGYPENQPVTEQLCYINHNKLLFVDVQQERSTRAKWLHCFENVGALLWFISIPDALARDATGEYPSEMARQIADFHSIYEGPVFRHMSSIVLIFTKPDVFSRLLATHSMTTYWPTYTNKFDDGANSKAAAKAAFDFICDQWITIPPRRVAATTIVSAGEGHGTEAAGRPLLPAAGKRYNEFEEFGGLRRHHQPDLYPMILNQCHLRVAELTAHNIHDICLRASLAAVG